MTQHCRQGQSGTDDRGRSDCGELSGNSDAAQDHQLPDTGNERQEIGSRAWPHTSVSVNKNKSRRGPALRNALGCLQRQYPLDWAFIMALWAATKWLYGLLQN